MPFQHSIGICPAPGILRIARLSHTPGGPTARVWHLRLPPDPDDTVRMIARFAAGNRLTGIPTVVGLNGTEAFLNILSGPRGDRKAWADALREHFDDLHAMAGSKTVSDLQTLPDIAGHRRVLTGIARQDAMDLLLKPVLEAGLRVVNVTPVSLALYNLVAGQHPRRETEIAVLCPIPDGGLEVLLGEGGNLRRLWRLPSGLETGQPAALRALTDGFATDRQSPNPERPRMPAPRLVVWCGPMPLPESVSGQITHATGAHVSPIAQWLPSHDAPLAEQAAPAIALGLYGTRNATAHLNLLPSPMRERILLRQRLPGWAAMAAMTTLIAASLSVQTYRRVQDAEKRLVHATAQRAHLEAMRDRRQALLAQNDRLRQQCRVLRFSAASPTMVRDLLSAIAQAHHPDDWIVRIADAPTYFNTLSALSSPSRPANGNSPPTFTFERQPVIVEGYTPGADLSSVRTLIEALRRHPKVWSVDLLGDDKVVSVPEREHQLLALEGRRFVLEIRLRES